MARQTWSKMYWNLVITFENNKTKSNGHFGVLKSVSLPNCWLKQQTAIDILSPQHQQGHKCRLTFPPLPGVSYFLTVKMFPLPLHLPRAIRDPKVCLHTQLGCFYPFSCLFCCLHSLCAALQRNWKWEQALILHIWHIPSHWISSQSSLTPSGMATVGVSDFNSFSLAFFPLIFVE